MGDRGSMNMLETQGFTGFIELSFLCSCRRAPRSGGLSRSVVGVGLLVFVGRGVFVLNSDVSLRIEQSGFPRLAIVAKICYGFGSNRIRLGR